MDGSENQTYDLNAKELVCSHHIKEKFISNYILKNGEFSKCTYCGQRKKVVELSEVLKLIVIGIDCLFEDANESRYYNKEGKHGYDGETIDFYDLYYDDELGLGITNNKLLDDIYKYLENEIVYCYKDEYGGESDYLSGLWNYFKEIVKHKARFVFYKKQAFSHHIYYKPSDILKRVQHCIIELDLFRTIATTDKLYRCVQHKDKAEVDNTGKRIAANPTKNCKKNNRMSPAGISMFYCCPHKDFCISEVVDFKNHSEPYYSVAFFTPKKKLKLVDLTRLPKMPSIFDKGTNGNIETLFFLKDFIGDISKPIKKGDEIIDYVPTQIVTEYIKYNPKLKVDGIIYPSSKNSKKENFVVFKDHDQSLNDLLFQSSSIITDHI